MLQIKIVMLNPQGDLFLSFVHLSNRMLKRMDGQLSVHGISFTEYQVLHHLRKAARETMTRIELARSVGLSASGVTRLIAPMEKLGLVEKESHPRDARISLVKLSNTGKKVYKDTSTTVSETAQDVFESLTDVQQKVIGDLSMKLF